MPPISHFIQIQAPRISYLALLIPEIRKNLCDLVLDETAAAALREEDWWFEAEKGNPLKWYVYYLGMHSGLR
jgi:autophagy-related protein 5